MEKDVLVMCQFFYPEYVSSATLPTQLAEDLVFKGLSVDVLCGYPKEYYSGEKVPAIQKYKDISIRRIKYAGFNSKKKIGRIINFFSFFVAVFFKIPSMFKYKCILVHSNPPILPIIPYLVSKISKTKFIFVVYDIYPDNALVLGAIKENDFIVRLMQIINKKTYMHASRIVAISLDMKKYILKNKLKSSKEKIIVIPNWYSGELIKEQTKIVNNEFRRLRDVWNFIVLYTGNMGEIQDMKTITDCILNLKNNKDILFIFTGHGSKVNKIKSIIYENKIKNVIIHGFVQGQDYSDIFNIADICLVSLKKEFGNLSAPSKIYGYLAAGKPVLAIMSENTDIVKKLMEHQAGNSVCPGDVQGLRKLILKYANDRELVKSSGLNAKKLYGGSYKREICTTKYYEMIKALIKNLEKSDSCV